MAKTKKLKAVASLGELYRLAETDERYRNLLLKASRNLGGTETADPKAAYHWLRTNAAETSERGVLAEVNFLRGLV